MAHLIVAIILALLRPLFFPTKQKPPRPVYKPFKLVRIDNPDGTHRTELRQ